MNNFESDLLLSSWAPCGGIPGSHRPDLPLPLLCPLPSPWCAATKSLGFVGGDEDSASPSCVRVGRACQARHPSGATPCMAAPRGVSQPRGTAPLRRSSAEGVSQGGGPGPGGGGAPPWRGWSPPSAMSSSSLLGRGKDGAGLSGTNFGLAQRFVG
jgi:hypothetical protein